MDVQGFLGLLKGEKAYRGQIEHLEVIPQRPASYVPLPDGLHPRLVEALAERGITSLYPHQARAVEAVMRGKHVIVASGTASGKSLCYHLPAMDAVLKEPASRALYLFPTKALAQDQLRSLYQLGLEGPVANTYDGDTPPGTRAWIRRNSHVVLSNPDMLHLGILPNHRLWSGFLGRLRYVVVDEAHVARGVFGSHAALVLRRLRRLCAYYGSDPRFVLTTATIGNPEEHARALTGLPVEGVTEDTSPRGAKTFVLWNPPAGGEDEEEGEGGGEAGDEAEAGGFAIAEGRRSSNSETQKLLLRLVTEGVRAIAFSRSRKAAEQVYAGVRRGLAGSGRGDLAGSVASYRGGYLPEERRAIERRLFAGELLAVSCTNALELGIDLGELEACVINGYPGTLSSTWQQAGRAGRRQEQSLAVLVGKDDPLDQYLMRNPAAIFSKPVEEAVIDLDNPGILAAHLRCAAFELPLTSGDEACFGPGSVALAEEMLSDGRLRRARGRCFSSGDNPAAGVNLRSASNRAYRIVERATGALLGTVDEGSAFFDVHPGAVYLHQGDPYEVKELDLEKRLALVEEAEDDVHTQPRDSTDVGVLSELDSFGPGVGGKCGLRFGEVEVVTRVYAYQKRGLRGRRLLETVELDLPPMTLKTRALWYVLPQPRLAALGLDALRLAGGLHAAEHAAIAMLPLFAMCDRRDVGGVSTAFHAHTGEASIFIYDAYEGGAGIARKGFEKAAAHLAGTAALLRGCPCASGCPSCVQSPKCGSGNEPLDKEAAGLLLGLLLEDLAPGPPKPPLGVSP